MTRTYLPGVLAMAAIVVASNILVQFLFGQWLTWGAFTYPLAFLVTDIMNRVYGARDAREGEDAALAVAGVSQVEQASAGVSDLAISVAAKGQVGQVMLDIFA